MTPRPELSIQKVLVAGADYYPIVDSRGQYLSPGAIEALATAPDPTAAGVIRRLRAVLLTEEIPRPALPNQPHHQDFPFDLSQVAYAQAGLPLLHADLPIGHVERIERTGGHLIGVLRLDGTMLAKIVWHAIQDGTLREVCCTMIATVPPEGEGAPGTVAWASIVAHGCLDSARITEWWWESRDDGTTVPALDLTGVRAMLGPDVAEGAADLVPPALRRAYEAEVEAALRASGEWCGP